MATKANEGLEDAEILHRSCPNVRIVELPMFPREIVGVEKLKEIRRDLLEEGG